MKKINQQLEIPRDRDDAVLDVAGHQVKLTNLRKVFWPGQGITKGDLLQYRGSSWKIFGWTMSGSGLQSWVTYGSHCSPSADGLN